ncbi:MAG: hypothetical protein ACRDDM_03500 [Paraclostridium sp.]
MYILNESIDFECGFEIDSEIVLQAIISTNKTLCDLPTSLFKTIDFKTTSAMIGCVFCESISNITDSIVNPIEKGHPDIIPSYAFDSSEEELKNFPVGLEVKCTIGGVSTGANLKSGQSRIDKLTSVTWQAHHQEVDKLMGITWDFISDNEVDSFPVISGVFYSNNLSIDDWGSISGTTGRNTKVCGMTSSGKDKMGQGWVAMINNPKYIEKYSKLFKINILNTEANA